MVSLNDMSAELLLNIASWLGDSSRPTRTRQRDLCNFSLTARKYCDISQEILHQWITLQPPTLMSTDQDRIFLGPPGPPRVAKLARTLAERPDLGQKVRYLDLCLVWQAPSSCNSSGVCPGLHTCGWDSVMSSCIQFLDSQRCAWAPREAVSRWRERICPGSCGQDCAFAGIILSSTPALEELSMRSYYWQRNTSVSVDPENDGSYGLPVESLCPSGDQLAADFIDGDIEGWVMPQNLAVVPGLANLRHLRANGMTSWEFVTLPRLQSFQWVLHSGWLDFGLSQRDWDALRPIPGSAESQITRMSIETMLTILNPGPFYPDDRIDYLRGHLLPNLPLLKHLSIRLVTRSGWKARHFYTVVGLEYGRLVSVISALNLETLMIDTTEAYEDDFSRKGLLRAVQPAQSLSHLTKLRRLVAPQEFFFPVYSDHYPEFSTCELPSSIQSIEVLDSTVAMKKYAKDLYDNRSSLPDLRTIVGWRDREEHHLAPDNRLKPDVAPMLIDLSTAWEDHCRDWARFWAVSNSIWSQLEGAGVKVDWKQSHSRGWRET